MTGYERTVPLRRLDGREEDRPVRRPPDEEPGLSPGTDMTREPALDSLTPNDVPVWFVWYLPIFVTGLLLLWARAPSRWSEGGAQLLVRLTRTLTAFSWD